MKRSSRALEVKRRAPQTRDDPSTDNTSDLPLVGRTPAMQGLYRLVARVMNTALPVLITGESGTGKSLIARAIHDFSDRRNLPFVVVSGADLEGMEGPSTALARAKGGSLLFEADHFLARLEREGAPLRRLAASAADLVRNYSWPGNVRQLENAIRRLVFTATEDEITLAEVETVLGSQNCHHLVFIIVSCAR